MVYPAILPLMRTPRLPVVDWTDASRRFKWTRPFRRKTKSGFCVYAITFQLVCTLRIGCWMCPIAGLFLLPCPCSLGAFWRRDTCTFPPLLRIKSLYSGYTLSLTYLLYWLRYHDSSHLPLTGARKSHLMWWNMQVCFVRASPSRVRKHPQKICRCCWQFVNSRQLVRSRHNRGFLKTLQYQDAIQITNPLLTHPFTRNIWWRKWTSKRVFPSPVKDISELFVSLTSLVAYQQGPCTGNALCPL
jgi:hypothetical protein